MKKIALCFASVALAASCLMVAGCSGEASTESESTPVGAPALMPAGHDGRFESLGADGCYGCHGVSESGSTLLTGATEVPADHYVGGDTSSLQFDPNRAECLTCHAQG